MSDRTRARTSDCRARAPAPSWMTAMVSARSFNCLPAIAVSSFSGDEAGCCASAAGIKRLPNKQTMKRGCTHLMLTLSLKYRLLRADSPRGPAAIDQYRMSCNERRRRGGQKDDRPGNVHRLPYAMERRDALDDIGLEILVVKDGRRARRRNERRRNRVHRDAVRAPFHREAFRQMSDGGFRHA